MTLAERWKRIEETHPEPPEFVAGDYLAYRRDTDAVRLSRAIAQRDLLAEVAQYVSDCFAAAEFEGLIERLAESPADIGSLHDLVVRRLLPARHEADAILASLKPSTEVPRE